MRHTIVLLCVQKINKFFPKSHFSAKRGMTYRLTQILAGFLILLLIAGCKNPFATREPEEPQKHRSSWVPPTIPEIVMDNLKNAVNECNQKNYLSCLAEDSTDVGQIFRFEADQTAILKNPGVFANWNFQSESNYIHLLFSKVPKDSSVALILSTPTPVQDYISKDTVVYIREYDLNVHHTIASDQCPRRVKGYGEFHLAQKHDGNWVIYFWRDTAIETYPSWSDLKAYSW